MSGVESADEFSQCSHLGKEGSGSTLSLQHLPVPGWLVGEERMCEMCSFHYSYSEGYGAALFLDRSSQCFMVMLV